MDDHRIEINPGIPTEPSELREWLAEWHRENNNNNNNTTTPEGKRPGYILTDKGRLLLGLGVGGKN